MNIIYYNKSSSSSSSSSSSGSSSSSSNSSSSSSCSCFSSSCSSIKFDGRVVVGGWEGSMEGGVKCVGGINYQRKI